MSGYLKRSGTVAFSFMWLYRRIDQGRAQAGSLYICLRQRDKLRRLHWEAQEVPYSLVSPSPFLHK